MTAPRNVPPTLPSTAVSAALSVAPAVESVPVVSVMDGRATLPAWSLRPLVGAVASAQLAVLWVDGAPPGALIVLGLIALSAVLVPASPAAGMLGGGAAILLAVFGEGDPVRPMVLATVVLVHLLHVITGVSAVVPQGARIHLGALRRPALRFVVVQGVVLALAGLAALLPRGATPAIVEIAALLGVTIIAAIAVVLLWRQ